MLCRFIAAGQNRGNDEQRPSAARIHRRSVSNMSSLFQASRLFDAEGRKKFFTLDMNNILLE